MKAPWTAVHETPNRSRRQSVPRKGVVLHHAAMTSLSGLRRLAMGAKEVSATAICKDGDLELLVPNDADRPWSLASAWGDSSFRSIETCNESTNGWTISDASHWSLARAVAFWAVRDGFRPNRWGPKDTWTVLGHREVSEIYDVSYGTECPGGMDLDLVTRRALVLMSGSVPASDDSLEDDMFTDEDRAQLRAVYAALFGARNLTGKADVVSWKNIEGRTQTSKYGVLPILIETQRMIAERDES